MQVSNNDCFTTGHHKILLPNIVQLYLYVKFPFLKECDPDVIEEIYDITDYCDHTCTQYDYVDMEDKDYVGICSHKLFLDVNETTPILFVLLLHK